MACGLSRRHKPCNGARLIASISKEIVGKGLFESGRIAGACAKFMARRAALRPPAQGVGPTENGRPWTQNAAQDSTVDKPRLRPVSVDTSRTQLYFVAYFCEYTAL